ncbi:MAG: dihydroxy-acid dehydratase, partial [Myxococcota bacterium]
MTDTPEAPGRRHSRVIVDGPERAPARGMLRAVGFRDEDFERPQVGVASLASGLTPCNMHLDGLAEAVEEGIRGGGATPVRFGTITVSDGISMGTPGMRYSLVSREVIADSIETVVGAQGFDGVVTVGGCDKNIPGCVMAILRLNRPGVFVYGGTIDPGRKGDQDLDIISIFEAVGQHASGTLSDKGLRVVEANAIPGPGSCGGMYTANTMASAVEALGLSLPNASSTPALSDEMTDRCRKAGGAVTRLLDADVRPRDIVTRKSLENAITAVIALGGSTNAVLHLLA